jgi:hypothetical protein
MYLKPINMGWGETKLSQICLQEMDIDPKAGGVFLFFNKKQDQMKLFYLDQDGSQEFMKMLPRGGFMLPAPKPGESYVKIGREKLNSLFRTTIFG